MVARPTEPTESHVGMEKDDEAHRAHIAKKRQRRAIHAMTIEQSRTVHTMVVLPPKEEKDESDDRLDSSGSESI